MELIILGLAIAAIGLIVIVKGKIPFLKIYHGVAAGKEKLHCRIEGGVVTAVGVIVAVSSYRQIPSSTLVILILSAIVVGVGFEIALKVFD